MRTMNLWCSVVVAMVMAGCFFPAEDVFLGTVDSGSTGDAGASGGGAGGGMGGGAAGGGAAGGGGGGAAQDDAGITLADAGLVARLPALPEANCGRPVPNPCTNDGGCFHLLGLDGGSETFHVFPRGTVSTWGTAKGGLIYQSDANATLWFAAPGRAPSALRSTATANGVAILPRTLADSPSYGFWFVMEDREAVPQVKRLMLSIDGETANVTNPIDAEPTSNALAIGTDYFVGIKDELRGYYPAGNLFSRQITSVSGQPEEIVAIAGDDIRQLFFLQCASPLSGSACSLWTYEAPINQTPRVTMLVRELPPLGGSVAPELSIRVAGDWVYLLGVQYLLRIPRSGGALEVVYRGEPFPQYGGTLKAGSLEVVGGKLYFGSVCHFDADLPGYGTIELDPATMSARWLDLDPRWPVVPHVTGYEPWQGWGGPWATPRGTFVVGF